MQAKLSLANEIAKGKQALQFRAKSYASQNVFANELHWQAKLKLQSQVEECKLSS